MKRPISVVLLLVAFLVRTAIAEGDVHWSYSGARGPEHWGELSEAFAACSEGRNQSPIDIVDPIEADLGVIRLAYGGSTTAVLNNGHTLQVAVGPGSTLDVQGQAFELVQFHVHSPSEHRIQGKSFPLEAHFVHTNDRGEMAVLAVLFREGPANSGLARIGASRQVGSSEPLDVAVAKLQIVPDTSAYYRYSGSLTTPPCTEGVLWLVLEATSTVAGPQVETFVKLIGEDARAPQPLNGRVVLHYSDARGTKGPTADADLNPSEVEPVDLGGQ
jgi:carbonic anhydrase